LEDAVVSEVSYLLEQLDQLLNGSRRLPWGRQALVDTEAVRTIIDQVRHALPEQVRQAEWIIQERDRIIGDAGRQADQVMHDAMQRVHLLAADSEVVKEAQERADRIVEEAERRAQEIHSGAIAYADGVLGHLDSQIAELKDKVRQNRESLKPRLPGQ